MPTENIVSDSINWTWALLDSHGNTLNTYGKSKQDYEHCLNDARFAFEETGFEHQVAIKPLLANQEG